MQLVADNLQITDPEVAGAVKTLSPQPIRQLIARCLAAGAQAIDINPGPLKRQAEAKMRFLVKTVRQVCDLPILLDTTNPTAIEAGLDAGGESMIINGFSLEPAKLSAILPLARRYKVPIIGYLLQADGQVPADAHERMTTAVDLYGKFRQAGLSNEQLIIDPVVAPLTWQDGKQQDMAILEVLRHLPDLLGFKVRTIAGLSNLTSGGGNYRQRIAMETAYLPMLASAGLDMVLLNMNHGQSVACARACGLLLAPGPFAWSF